MALTTIRWVKLIKKKEFAAIIFDLEYEIFVIHVLFISSTLVNVHSSYRFQITDIIAKKTFHKSLPSMLTL